MFSEELVPLYHNQPTFNRPVRQPHMVWGAHRLLMETQKLGAYG